MEQCANAPGRRPLAIAFDGSVCRGLRDIVLRNSALFQEDRPDTADVILFGTDTIRRLEQNGDFRRHRQKSICVTETDTPTFFLPGLYAANRGGALTHARTKTIPYLISLEFNANTEIARLRDQTVEKQYLYAFLGGNNSWARRRILKYVAKKPDTILESTDAYYHWAEQDAGAKRAANRRYAQVLAASKFVLCPRGCGLSSYRLFETMSLGVAPVIIADGWTPIDGIDWTFALFVPERRICDIDSIVRSHEDEWEDRGRAARAAYADFLAPDAIPFLVHRQIVELLVGYSAPREAVMSRLAGLRFAYLQRYWAGYSVGKRLILEAFRFANIPFPFALYQSNKLGTGRAPDTH